MNKKSVNKLDKAEELVSELNNTHDECLMRLYSVMYEIKARVEEIRATTEALSMALKSLRSNTDDK